MKYKTKNKNTLNKKIVLLVAIPIILVAAGLFVYIKKDSGKNTASDVTATQTDSNNDFINFEPGTENDQKEADANKQKLANESGEAPTSVNSEISPTITFAGVKGSSVEIRSYVSNVLEDGGTCKAVFTKGNQTITKNSKGIMDATYTMCKKIELPVSEFPSRGGWKVAVTYSSTTASGTSDKTPVEGL